MERDETTDERLKYKEFSRDELESWIPLYLNGRLAAEQRRILEEWLQSDEQANRELESWREVRAAVMDRPHHKPNDEVWTGLADRLDRELQSVSGRRVKVSFASLVSGIVFMVLSLLLLWLIIRPGILLQWTISEPAVVNYRIYRAPANSGMFSLVEELPGNPGLRNYSYLDSLFVPGLQYIYRVDGMDAANKALFSQAVLSSTAGALPGQAAILVASALVGLLAAGLVRLRAGEDQLSGRIRV